MSSLYLFGFLVVFMVKYKKQAVNNLIYIFLTIFKYEKNFSTFCRFIGNNTNI